MRIFKRKGSPNWWVTWSDQGGRLNRRSFGTTDKMLAETQAAQLAKVKKVAGWGIFCVSVVIGVLLGLSGTEYALVWAGLAGRSAWEAGGWMYFALFLFVSWAFGACIGLIGWGIKRALTKTEAASIPPR